MNYAVNERIVNVKDVRHAGIETAVVCSTLLLKLLLNGSETPD